MAAQQPPKLPPISDLPALDHDSRTSILSTLFEPSPALAALAAPIIDGSTAATYASYDELIALIGAAMRGLAESNNDDDEAGLRTLDGILCAHPRLGEKKVDSAMSRLEQAAMGGGKGDGEDEAARQGKEREDAALRALNAEYEAAYPGLIYTVFVAGRPRPVIMEDMRRRIARGDRHAERLDAIEAMCAIASDRAKKLQ